MFGNYLDNPTFFFLSDANGGGGGILALHD